MICVVVLFQLISIIGIQAIKPADIDTVIAELVRKQHDQQMYIRHLVDEIQDLKKTAREQQKLVSRNTDMVTNLQESSVEQRDAIERLFEVTFVEEKGKHHSGQQSGISGILSVKVSKDNLNSTQLRKQETLNELDRSRQIRSTVSGTAFYAYMPTNEVEPGPDHTLIFRSVVTNIGNHYNQHNGMFTCPSYGVYAFSWTIVVGDYIGTQLVVNSNTVGAMYTTAYQVGDIRTTTGMVIVEVNQGDVVYVRVNSDPAVHHKGNIYSASSSYKTSFCGWKLF